MTDLTPERRALIRRSVSTSPEHVISVDIPDLLALLDAADERDRLAAAIERVRALHRPFGIYDECDCDDDAKAEDHEDIYEVGLTCNKLYDICAECCRDDVYQSEVCASAHEHRPDETHHCATLRALDGTDDRPTP